MKTYRDILFESVNLKALEREALQILKDLNQRPVGKQFPEDQRGWEITKTLHNGKPSLRIEWVAYKQYNEIEKAKQNKRDFFAVAYKKWKDVVEFQDSQYSIDIILVPK